MKNKVLIKVTVPSVDREFDLFIPVNEAVWKVNKLMTKSVSDLTGIPFQRDDFVLLNKDNGKRYTNNQIIINTDIRNGTELILTLSK